MSLHVILIIQILHFSVKRETKALCSANFLFFIFNFEKKKKTHTQIIVPCNNNYIKLKLEIVTTYIQSIKIYLAFAKTYLFILCSIIQHSSIIFLTQKEQHYSILEILEELQPKTNIKILRLTQTYKLHQILNS